MISSREGAGYIRRRRVCPSCGQRFTTHEYLAQPTLFVVKKDGRREPFDREKVLRGMQLACTKRPVATAAIEQAVAMVEAALVARAEAEVPSALVGELVLAELARLDSVAYVRFASVYRQFPDLAALQAEIGALTRELPTPTAGALTVDGQRVPTAS
ncbi:MAG: transcriptional repressor NrdR [Dehalococcoidia bacterium]|nr:MAG: transcriptional repressor NrdR [Dehalococcoidia bacterium]